MVDRVVTQAIACTPENKAEFRAAIRRWPEVDALMLDLHAQGFLPGLRAVQITLTGPSQQVSKGLEAIDFTNGPSGLKGAQ